MSSDHLPSVPRVTQAAQADAAQADAALAVALAGATTALCGCPQRHADTKDGRCGAIPSMLVTPTLAMCGVCAACVDSPTAPGRAG